MPNAAARLSPRLFPVGTRMVVFWFQPSGGVPVPTTLTLKNIPDEIYVRLKTAAALHRRSLNSEAIVCLETVLAPGSVPPDERLARARALRAGLKRGAFDSNELDAMKRQGRA